MATGFAAGLAEGINNGINMYGRIKEIKRREAEEAAWEEIKAEMAKKASAQSAPSVDAPIDVGNVQGPAAERPVDAGATQTFPVTAPGDVVAGQTAAQPLVQSPIMTQPVDTQGNSAGAAQAYPVQNSAPIQPGQQPVAVSQEVAGIQASPSISTLMQHEAQAEALGLRKKKEGPDNLNQSSSLGQPFQAGQMAQPQTLLGGGEFGDLSDRLTRGLYKAIEIGAFDQAINLMSMREKVIGPYRDQALGEAMSRFDLTGDPNAFVPFVNRFMPTSIRFDRVETGGQTADGQPVYVARGVNTETGKPFEHVLSRETFMRYVSAAGDGAAYRKMFVDQAQYLHDMQKFKEQERFKTDERVREKTTLDEKGIDASDKEPAIVKTANWLIRTGAAKSSADAYRMARNLGGKNREDYALEYAKIRMKGQESPFGVPAEDAITLTEALNEGRAAYDQNVGGDSDGSGSTPGQAASPGGKLPDAKPGMVLNGYRFKGGDENKSENWEKI